MEWVSVEDRLPEQDCVCVVWNEKRPFQYYISNYSHYFKEFEVYMIGVSRLNDPICFNATHWMSLPEKTNEKDQLPKIELGRHDFPISIKSTLLQ